MTTPTRRVRTGMAIRLALALGLASLASDTAFAQPRRMAPAEAIGTLRLPDGVTSVTVPFRKASEHILIPVSVNGSQPLPMVLDTGMPAGGVALYDGKQVQALGLEYEPMRARVGGAGGGPPLEAKIATGLSIKIGEAEISETRGLVLPRVPYLAAMHAGVIGVELFRRFVVTIDHDRGVVQLTVPGSHEPPMGAGEVTLDLARGIPFIDAALVTPGERIVPLRFVLDLGATHPVSLNLRSSELIEVPEGALRTRIGRGVMGPVEGRVGRISGLVLGGQRLNGLIATFPDSAFENPRGMDSRNGNLGSGVLGRFNVTLDYASSTMYLVPNRRFTESFEWDMSGLILDPDERGGLVVAGVDGGSPAAAAGIAAGDTLLAVDQERVSSADLPRLRELFRRDGATVELRLRRVSTTRNVTLRLRRAV